MYKPNLDRYPEQLAHQFAKREMSSESFKLDFAKFEREFIAGKKALGLSGKLSENDLKRVRNHLRLEYKFVAGVLNQNTKNAINSNVATVWLSDDTLMKQFQSREDQNFTSDEYQKLPDILNAPTETKIGKKANHFELYKVINGKRYLVVIKVLANEIFVQSFRRTN
ncbi:hypothetical protein ACFFHK_07050 [Gallibacterium trehalosifermentans]|uniref:Phage-Barnase-EndoU-ColicinE5/D-RelE like nuclease 3 domain-containing protein n=1 Tax=Gallibacterium trehalosifermentans TaxID=516935 RepID=A0ABV6H2C1_9PAST